MVTIFKRIQVKRFDMFKIDDISVARVHSYLRLLLLVRVSDSESKRKKESEQLKNRCFELHKLTVIYKQNPISK